MKTSKKILLLALLVSAAFMLLLSCKKDKPEPTPPAPRIPEPAGQKIYILNEGNFEKDNGSVSLYDPKTKAVEANRFGSQNNGAKLGDVPQSMLLSGSNIFIVVNNSSKIVRCNLDLVKQSETTGLTSPRYVLPFNGEKAYVSDMIDPLLKIMNLSSGVIEGSVQLTSPTERMALLDGKVYATSMGRDYVYIIDVASQKLTDSILVGPGAGSLVFDKSSNLWVLATGNYLDKGGRLSKIRVSDKAILENISFASNQWPSKLTLSYGKDSLLYLLGGVNAVSINNPQLPAAPFIPARTRNFYGLGVNPKDGNIYLTDAIDYSQPSDVLIYSSKGDSLSRFKAGVIASDFLFN
jgi:YVTN family beta-propeller protein